MGSKDDNICEDEKYEVVYEIEGGKIDMQTDVLVSVIMPVYNGEKVITSSIKSILEQNLEKIELIVIDDCSTDSTVEKIRIIQQQDSRVRLIQQPENRGPGAAKNAGLKAAIGEYIAFCDADDWIEKDMMEALLENVQKREADVAVSGFFLDECKETGELLKREKLSMEHCVAANETEVAELVSAIDRNKLYAYACNKIYKSSIIKKNNVIFSDKLFGEDYDFNMDFFGNAQSAVVVSECYYHYIKMNKESLTKRFIPDYYEIIVDRFEKMRSYMKQKNVYEGKIKEVVLTVHIKHLMAAIARSYNKRMGFTFAARYQFVKKIFKNEFTEEAIEFSKAYNMKEKIVNGVFKTQNILLNLLFGKLVSKIL